MKIRINNTTLDKNDLLKRIEVNKIEAIKHIREKANIGLKDAHEIMDNLCGNPDFYDRVHIKKPSRIENKPQDNRLKEKLITIDKSEANKQLYLGFALLFVILLVLFLFNY